MIPLLTHRYKHTILASIISVVPYSPAIFAEEETETNEVDAVKKLDQLVVSASGHEQELTDAPASITVITQQDLENKPYKDVTDALQDVPGVMVTGGGSTQDITMRGLSGKYTLILVDGKRQGSRETRPNSDGPGIEQGWTPPLSAIERIEVIRGPMSSLYGSDALGGVINIITKKVQDHWGGEVSISSTVQESSQSGDSQQADIMLNGPIIKDKVGLQVYGQVFHRQADSTSIDNGYNKQDIKNGTAKLSWQIDPSQDLVFEAGKERQSRDTTTYDRDHFALTHNIHIGQKHLETYVTHEKIDNPTRDMFYQDTVVSNKTTLPFEVHTLTLGGQYEYQQLDDANNYASNGINQLTRWQAALFVEDEYFVTDNFSVTTGLRFNKDQNYGDNVSPRLYGNWSFAPHWTLKGGISTGYRSPDLRQGTDGWGQPTGQNSAIILGNSDLKPEESVSAETGLYWSNNHGTHISGTLYRTNYKNKISEERVCDTAAGDASCSYAGSSYSFISERYNVDRVVIKGVELTLGTPISENVSLTGNYTYTESEQKTGEFAGHALNRLPKHMVNATTNWQMSDQMKSWLRVNFHGESSEGLNRTSMENSVPSYTFVDTGMSYAFNSKITLYMGIYNLLDKTVDYDTYGKALDGRRYNAKLKMAF